MVSPTVQQIAQQNDAFRQGTFSSSPIVSKSCPFLSNMGLVGCMIAPHGHKISKLGVMVGDPGIDDFPLVEYINSRLLSMC